MLPCGTCTSNWRWPDFAGKTGGGKPSVGGAMHSRAPAFWIFGALWSCLAPLSGVCLFLFGLLLSAGAVAAPQCKLALDTGHTRASPGATSARGVGEWTFNRSLTQTVADSVAARGYPVVLVNPEGGPISLQERPLLAADSGADLFLSVHHDSVQPQYLSSWMWQGQRRLYSDRFDGFSLFVSGKSVRSETSRRFAEAIADGLLRRALTPTLHHAEPIKGENRPLLDSPRGLYQFDDLVVLKTSPIPAVLLEAGVIVHRTAELRVQTPAYRQAVADAVADAVVALCPDLKR